MHDRPLVMPADLSLHFSKAFIGMQVHHPVMKSNEHSLQLGYDHIFIVARITNDRTFWSIFSAGIGWFRISPARYGQIRFPLIYVQRVIIFSHPTHINRAGRQDPFHIYCPGRNGVYGNLPMNRDRFLSVRNWPDQSNVMIDELAQVSVSRRNAGIFFIIPRIGVSGVGSF